MRYVWKITFNQIFAFMKKFFPFTIVAIFAALISYTENKESVGL